MPKSEASILSRSAPSIISQTPILFLPNSFTPNGDEHNEIFKPITNFVSDIGYEFSIYSRNGELIFTTNNPGKGWNGTFKGSFVKNDNYVFHVSYVNGIAVLTEKTGFVSLIRWFFYFVNLYQLKILLLAVFR